MLEKTEELRAINTLEYTDNKVLSLCWGSRSRVADANRLNELIQGQ